MASDLAVAPDGSTVFVTGGSIGVAPRYSVDYTTIAYDAATGTQRWLTRYYGPVRGDDGASAIAIAPDGSRLFVTGTSPSNGSFNYVTVSYKATNGMEQWVATYDAKGKLDDVAHDLMVSQDGTAVFVTGFSEGATSGDEGLRDRR